MLARRTHSGVVGWASPFHVARQCYPQQYRCDGQALFVELDYASPKIILTHEDGASRTVYALGADGRVVAFQPIARVTCWTDAKDDAIRKPAEGVFLGFGLLQPPEVGQIHFVIRSDGSGLNQALAATSP